MTEQEFRSRLTANLIKYRKLNGLTQLELADCLNYSDKSVSKWERGDGMPDVFVLARIALLYGISVSELIGETDKSKKTAELEKALDKSEKAREKARKKVEKRAGKQKKKERKNA
ncbi:MAG: helix-turn-helix transcriptional regulator [Clostridia bacterium]|nr:helix-turn-helix transcriptional regulator [Clostridia bacterium]